MKRILFALALIASFALPATPAQAAHEFLCKPGPPSAWNIAHGTNGADTFTGAAHIDDCYDGKQGADSISLASDVQSGYNRLLGGAGNDTIVGGDQVTGIDAINGEAGNDYVYGLRGGDFGLFGGAGSDTVKGNDGNDNLFGGGFCVETSYWGFNDWSDPYSACPDCPTNPCAYSAGDDGADQLYGGDGDDWIWESNSDVGGDNVIDYVNGGAGNDICSVEAIDTVVNCETVNVIP